MPERSQSGESLSGAMASDARAALDEVQGLFDAKRLVETVAACEKVVERFADEADPAVRERVAHALVLKGLSLDGLGIGAGDALAVGASGALMRYLKELQPAGVSLAPPIVERAEGILPLDEMTRRNLELVESLRGGSDRGTEGTLIDVLDRTATPMGARILRQWILAPLAEKEIR